MRLILASQSPYRKRQLESLALKFESYSPAVDEENLKDLTKPPAELAAFLAEAKALSLRPKFPSAWILGADQLVHFKGQILGKSAKPDKAKQQLLELQGKEHELITSFYLSGPDEHFKHTDLTKMFMRKLTEEEIEAYLKQDQPFDCAGSYKLEKAGISLFEKIESEDFSAIQGLPLMAFTHYWKKATGQLPFIN